MTDPELKTAAELRELAKKHPREAKVLERAAAEIEDLVKRLDSVWEAHRWCGDS